MFSGTYQSLPESLVLFFSSHSSFFFSPLSDSPQLVVRWSRALDRGVRPLISKRSPGAYGEKNLPLNIPSIVSRS